MKISFAPIQNYNSGARQKQTPSSDLKYQYNLNADTVSFGAIKKNKLDGYQLLSANYFKAPLEKFKDQEDFKDWARTSLSEKMKPDSYPCESELDSKEREKRLTEWRQYMFSDRFMLDHPTLALYVADSITKDLYPDTKNFPPLFDTESMKKTLNEIDVILEKNPKANISFPKKYNHNLKQKMLNAAEKFPDQSTNGRMYWVRVPSFEHDPEHIDKNLKIINCISAEAWCTKGHFASKYLKNGDFFILMDKNNPELSVRLEGEDKIAEVRDRNHNSNFGLSYLEPLKTLAQEKNLSGFEGEFQNLQRRQDVLNIAKEISADDIQNKNYANILRSSGIEVKELDDGMLELAKFQKAAKEFTYEDLGISENEMFKHIKKINGNANFEGTQVTNLGALKEIGGYTFASQSKLNYESFKNVKQGGRTFWD
ncbi:MAG: hypothetical protein PHV37_04235 [Candidatus Gastranaerophilales bacterium]|nr:hypothetical protein [Candidatus Gastranaerophilales bacterium]